MGACGCADNVEDRAVRLPDGTVLAYGVYPGCESCGEILGFGIRLYDTEEHASQWITSEIKPFAPGEFGGNDGNGLMVAALSIGDLVAAVRAVEPLDDAGTSTLVGEGGDQYATIADWLEDNWCVVQDAIDRGRKE